MKKPSVAKGFTLIELIVVVGIIAILAAVVMAALNNARSKSGDTAIKSNLANTRTQAEILFANNDCYSSVAGDCTFSAAAAAACSVGTTELIWHDNQIETLITAAGNASNGGGIGRASCVQAANGGAWAISVPLKEVVTDSWCIDSTGRSKQVTPSGGDRGFSGNACK